VQYNLNCVESSVKL